jgi:hypothetical protein
MTKILVQNAEGKWNQYSSNDINNLNLNLICQRCLLWCLRVTMDRAVEVPCTLKEARKGKKRESRTGRRNRREIK